jgi:hypothetical protein
LNQALEIENKTEKSCWTSNYSLATLESRFILFSQIYFPVLSLFNQICLFGAGLQTFKRIDKYIISAINEE